MKKLEKKLATILLFPALVMGGEHNFPAFHQMHVADVPRPPRKHPGMKEFKYGEHSIFALNRKNADRKAKNLGLI